MTSALLDIPVQPAAVSGSTGYLFLPAPLRRARFLVWLRRSHAWLGLWGGVLGMLFGFTGIFLSHRSIMKIGGVHQAQTQTQFMLDAPPPSIDGLAARLQADLRLAVPAQRKRVEKSRKVDWGGQVMLQPERWDIVFQTPERTVQAEYWAGNRHVSLRDTSGNLLRTMTQFHKAEGVHPAWVLVADTVAGSLIMLCLTGFLLWSRLHGRRLLALGIGGAALVALGTAALMST